MERIERIIVVDILNLELLLGLPNISQSDRYRKFLNSLLSALQNAFEALGLIMFICMPGGRLGITPEFRVQFERTVSDLAKFTSRFRSFLSPHHPKYFDQIDFDIDRFKGKRVSNNLSYLDALASMRSFQFKADSSFIGRFKETFGLLGRFIGIDGMGFGAASRREQSYFYFEVVNWATQVWPLMAGHIGDLSVVLPRLLEVVSMSFHTFFNKNPRLEEAMTCLLNSENILASQNGICIVCLKEGKQKCGKCKIMRYCSRECQMANWKDHKKYCLTETFSEFTTRFLASVPWPRATLIDGDRSIKFTLNDGTEEVLPFLTRLDDIGDIDE